jgi:hypothetical protein
MSQIVRKWPTFENLKVSQEFIDHEHWLNGEKENWVGDDLFDDPHYQEVFEAMRRDIKCAGVGTGNRWARFVVSWLSKYLDTPFEVVLEAMVSCYNGSGARYTAWMFYLGESQRFDFLPKTGKSMSCGVAYDLRLRRAIKVPRHYHNFYPNMKERQLRKAPELKPIPSATPSIKAPEVDSKDLSEMTASRKLREVRKRRSKL